MADSRKRRKIEGSALITADAATRRHQFATTRRHQLGTTTPGSAPTVSLPVDRPRSGPVLALLLAGTAVLGSLGLGGCASRPRDLAPPVSPPAAFTAPGDRAMPDRWWRSFADPSLDTLVAGALRENLDLATAWERLREARSVARVAGADRWPDLSALVEGRIARPSADPDGTLDLGLVAGYEVDLWGRIAARARAEELRTGATLADYRATALMLSAEVTDTWYQLAEARAAADLLDRQITTNEEALELLRTRFGTGLVRRADILRQERLLESTRERALAVRARTGLLRHRLALLLGRLPTALADLQPGALPGLPPLPRTGVPAALVQRRPDVQSAYLRLQAADRDLAAAVAARYPRLSLTATASTTSAGADRLLDDWLRSLAGNLLAPIFQGGALSAEVDGAEARKQQRLLAYGQTVLAAIAEVEDALLREQTGRERLTSLEAQFRFAEETHRRLRLEYFNGMGDFLDVLTARIDQQQLERDLLAARLGLVQDRIALYRALAGSFATPREAAAREENP